MKKAIIKKMSEEELAMMVNIAYIDPFDAVSIMIRKGDIEKIIPSRPKCNDDRDDWSIPMKDMKRMERRKATFRKDKGRQTRARDLGYDLSIEDNPSKVRSFLSANHVDKAYSHGNKAQKKTGKPMTTKTALDLVEQMKWEAEMDREAERKEAEHQLVLDELASTTDDLSRLEFAEKEMTEAISELITTIYEANSKLVDYQAKINGLRAAETMLHKKIHKLEEAVNS